MPRVGKVIALLALALVPAVLSTQVSAAPYGAPLASALSIDVTWEIGARDGLGGFFPARYLYTEICDATGSVCFLDSGTQLDANGQATLTTTEYISGDITLQLWSSAEVNGNDILLYVNPPGGTDLWQFLTPAFPPAPSQPADVPFGEVNIPAYWIMDDFVESFLTIPSGDQGDVVFQGFWGPEWFRFGLAGTSFFCYDSPCQEPYMYLLEQDIQADPANNSVGLPDRLAIHESGHAVQYHMYGGKMPAQSTDYWLNGNCRGWQPRFAISGEPDCAWQEGWADYWRINALGTSTVHYLSGGQLNYETAVGLIDLGDEVPGRITGALWDIDDNVIDGSDSFANGFDVIWDSLKNFAFAADGTFDELFTEYWDTWRGRNTIGIPAEVNQCAVTSIYQNTITYAADAWLPCAGAQVGFQRVGAAGGPISGPEDLGGAGIPTGLIDAFEFEAVYGGEPFIVNVSGDVYAIVYEGPDDDGFLITLTIDSAGKVGSIIDTFEFDTSYAKSPFLFHVSGDIFGIAYSGPDLDGFLATVDITSTGVIDTVVDSLEFDTLHGDWPTVVHVSGDIYAISYTGSDPNALALVTVDIDATGTPLSAVAMVTDPGLASELRPTPFQVSGDVFAITYRGSSFEGHVMTRTISTAGVIGPVIQDFIFEPTFARPTEVFALSGDIFAIFGDVNQFGLPGGVAGAAVWTIDIDASGTPISNVAPVTEFDSQDAGFPHAVPVGGSLYAVSYGTALEIGRITTVDVPDSGVGVSVVGTFEFGAAAEWTTRPIVVAGSGGPGTVIAIAYQGDKNEEPVGGFVRTVAVGVDGYARVPLTLMDLISNGQSVEPTGGVLSFGNKVDYDPGGVQVLRVGYGEGFQELFPSSTIIDNATGTAEFFGFAPLPGANPPLAHGFVYPRLVGPAAQPYTFEWDSAAQPPDTYGYHWTAVGADVDNTEQITFRRGDPSRDGSIDAVDVTMLQRAIVGATLPCGDLANPTQGCINPADAASVKWDDCVAGDRINVYDAIVLAQFVTSTISVLPTTCDDLQGGDPAAVVTIATTTVATSTSGSVAITVSDLADANDLGGYDIQVLFDPSLIQVIGVTGGDAPFDASPTVNIDNVGGVVTIAFAIGDATGPLGTVEIANLHFSGLAPGTTVLDLTIRNMANTVPQEIPSSAVDGMVTVE